MTQIVDIKAFLATARTGSFSAAAREADIAASVLTKRVVRLEQEIGKALFTRSTRRLTLTSDGERLRPRLQVLVGELEEALRTPRSEAGVSGRIRIKAPTTVGTLYVGAATARFQADNPGVTTELLLIDRAVNPLEEGFDLALGALPESFSGVVDVPLSPYDRVLVASAGYLARRPAPRDPNDLVEHDCLVFPPIGVGWSFESARGTVAVEITARFVANDSRVLLDAALAGLGVAVLPRFVARDALAAGQLSALVPDYPVARLWFKAMIPRNKAHKPEIAALIHHLTGEFGPVPPWDR